MRALRKLQREQDPKSPFVFTSERGSPFTTAGFARMVERAGVEAKLGFPAHPHMLRHACGFALANKGHDTRALQAYLGHRNIQHTVRYTELSPGRFKDFWRRLINRRRRGGAEFFCGWGKFGCGLFRETHAGSSRLQRSTARQARQRERRGTCGDERRRTVACAGRGAMCL